MKATTMSDEALAICVFLASRPALLVDLMGFGKEPLELEGMTLEDLRYDTVIDAMRSVAYGQGVTLDALVEQLIAPSAAVA